MRRVTGFGASITKSFGSKNSSGRKTFSDSFWRIAVVTAAGAIGTASQAQAALYYWPDSDPGFSQIAPPVPHIRQKPRHRLVKKIEVPAKEAAKPQGPLIIAISIEKQNLIVYDANGFFAETPVSTGMRGHPTPMGVFSVIQKQKFHRSNIYSGAPMPYMQRITWSGVAMHAGVLPGYPASHGCIRMPMAFAVKMWGWTRMGARVLVTPGEMTPARFTHPLLVTQKAAPQADAPLAATIDKATGSGEKPVMAEPQASTALRDKTHIADARNAPAPDKTIVSNSDAAPFGGNTRSRIEADGAADADAKSEIAQSKTDSTAKDVATVGVAEKPVATQLPENATSEIKPRTMGALENIAAAADAGADVPDGKKDQIPAPQTERVAAPRTEPATLAAPKHTGQIAMFISRKDSKLYVRQNFAPLFEVPVTIAPSDRPLGTHVFTAQVDKNDANVLRWSVLSLPATTRYAERRDEDEPASRKRKMNGAVEMKKLPMPDNPTEALDRLTIPQDAMARITEALSAGSSVIVSDQGIAAGETGEGTDFIVSLR